MYEYTGIVHLQYPHRYTHDVLTGVVCTYRFVVVCTVQYIFHVHTMSIQEWYIYTVQCILTGKVYFLQVLYIYNVHTARNGIFILYSVYLQVKYIFYRYCIFIMSLSIQVSYIYTVQCIEYMHIAHTRTLIHVLHIY